MKSTEELIPYLRDNKYGLADYKREIIVDCIYEMIILTNSRANLFSVKKNNKWGVINANGQEIIPCDYEDTFCVEDNSIIFVRKEHLWALCDKSGNFIYEFVFS